MVCTKALPPSFRLVKGRRARRLMRLFSKRYRPTPGAFRPPEQILTQQLDRCKFGCHWQVSKRKEDNLFRIPQTKNR